VTWALKTSSEGSPPLVRNQEHTSSFHIKVSNAVVSLRPHKCFHFCHKGDESNCTMDQLGDLDHEKLITAGLVTQGVREGGQEGGSREGWREGGI